MPSTCATILLIDDEPSLLIGLKAAMQRAQYAVLTASNGADGLRVAREAKPNLIISDVMMPPPGGFELRELLADDPETANIPFIFLTARASPGDVLHGLDSGADDYVTKPFRREELLARVRAVLRRHQLGCEAGQAALQAQMQRLETEITQNFSHELRTPLVSILGTLELALNEKFAFDDIEQHHFLQEFLPLALSNAQHLHSLVEDLILLHDIDTHQLNHGRQVLDPEADLHRPVMLLAQRWQSRKVRVRVEMPEDLVVHAPALELRQAILHLVDNGCKFGPVDGVVRVVFEPNGPGGCRVTVTDEGPGVPPELREKAYERFFQASQGLARLHGGLGVGLTIARAVARNLRGDVVFQEAPSGCQVALTIAPGPADGY